MDPRRFGRKKTGEFVELSSHGSFALKPALLPARSEMPAEFWAELVRVRQKMGELEGVGKILPNPAILLKPLRNREAIDSSTIEGTYATPRERLLFDTEDPNTNRGNDRVREVANYSRAIETFSKKNSLSFDDVKSIQKMLLNGTRGEEQRPGEVRDGQVAVGSAARFVPSPPELLPSLISNLDEHFLTLCRFVERTALKANLVSAAPDWRWSSL